MGRRNGGIAKEGVRSNSDEYNPVKNNIFFTHNIANVLLNQLAPHFKHKENPKILDACSGSGTLGLELMKYFDYNATLTLQDMEYYNKSVLDLSFEPQDIIIANPPFVPVTLPESIHHHLHKCLKPDGVLIFYINCTYAYQGWKRAISIPTMNRVYFTPRYLFKPAGKPLLDCCFLITHKDNNIPIESQSLNSFLHVDPELVNDDMKNNAIITTTDPDEIIKPYLAHKDKIKFI